MTGLLRPPDRRDRGASVVEYGLIVFAVAAVVSMVVFAFGRLTQETWQSSCETVVTATSSTESCSP